MGGVEQVVNNVHIAVWSSDSLLGTASKYSNGLEGKYLELRAASIRR